MAFIAFALSANAIAANEDSADTLELLVQQDLERDSNLFRMPDGTRPVIDGHVHPRSDLVRTTTVAGRFDRNFSRQRVNAEFGVTRSDYQEFAYLDYTARNAFAAWEWALGNQWRGELSARQNEALRSFAERNNTVRSVNTYRRYAFDANYQLHPRWSLGAGLANVISSYDDRLSASSEFVEDAVELRATFRPGSDNSLMLVARNADGRYPERIAGPTAVTDYGQRDLQMRGDWRASGLSRVFGYLGYTWRDYPGLSEKNFSGVTGRVGHHWTPGGKLAMRVTARREIGAREDVVDNFIITRSLAIEPEWKVSSKVSLQGRLEWLARDYGGNPFVVATNDRQDITRIASIGGVWSPMRDLGLALAIRRESRSSSGAGFGYRSDSVLFSVKYAL
ncbi:XrtB/PEP-CTERM-associated polysaccharide biosynthesis outer membrane protein EpsL [Aromatoleum diolicum]|uniref:Outer membrane beta-barrel protein n=1 Tax=Aromatoleum diolicum TaxID=75796 RepID=A0ABX1QH17_9RHOO|nr:XrtB/PEP-CTERM-associated polysaccharide biosynthesis outer membrane protein EpsL [Aromatoleum diolicum]NMG76652.1 outer membrane beta-barrel protein [Aromatoleum diolicum]